MGDFRTARNAFLAILKRFPHDLTVLRELHTILVELSDLSTCASLLQEALDYYMKTYSSGRGENISGGGFSKLDLLLLADLYNVLGEHGMAVETIRRGTRWLQGRSDQKYWDLCEDDREYDAEGWLPRAGADESGAVQAGNHELDPNTRHRLAVARIKMGDVEEGKVSFELVPLIASSN
jgi:general transcription factor 3C polypeptide 3 (transcription factor C subunit 4)